MKYIRYKIIFRLYIIMETTTITEYSCTCRPSGSHVVGCVQRHTAHVRANMQIIRNMLDQIRRSKVGNPEIFESGKRYHYAITLTGHACYKKILNSIYTSKMFGATAMCYGEEQNPNDTQNGWKHLHILLRTKKFVDSKEVYVKNKKLRVDVKLLRTELSLMKWHRYIHKETTFGDCCVDSSKAKLIILPNNNNVEEIQVVTI